MTPKTAKEKGEGSGLVQDARAISMWHVELLLKQKQIFTKTVQNGRNLYLNVQILISTNISKLIIKVKSITLSSLLDFRREITQVVMWYQISMIINVANKII